jgi:predicted PurR-regulated permease PerM
MAHTTVSPKQKRTLTIALILALAFAAYFLKEFFSLIVFAMIMAYLFNPTYKWFGKRIKSASGAASLTLITALIVLIIPLILLVLVSTLQIKGLLNSFSASNLDIGKLGQQGIDWANHLLAHVPGSHTVTTDQVRDGASKVVNTVGHWALGVLSSSASGITGFFTSLILFIYIFLNFLTNQDRLIAILKRLNPLGDTTSELYLKRMAGTTSAMVRGQFVIALCQGLSSAIILYIAGLHSIFFFMFMALTFLSVIPLGGGIVVLPIGIAMLLTGHIWQGLVVLLGHFLIVTNIDNVLRPRLVPKNVRLNSALTLLAVFAGVAMFGFLGIIIGPVIMIIITTTLEIYFEATEPAK